METDFGALYSLAVTKKHIITGKHTHNTHVRTGTHTPHMHTHTHTHTHACTCTHTHSGTHNQNIQVYDISTRKHVCSLSGHIGIVTVLKVTESQHGGYMFSGSSDTTVQVGVVSG